MTYTMEGLAEKVMSHGGPLAACMYIKPDELPADAELRMDWTRLRELQNEVWNLEAEIAARILTREQMHHV